MMIDNHSVVLSAASLRRSVNGWGEFKRVEFVVVAGGAWRHGYP